MASCPREISGSFGRAPAKRTEWQPSHPVLKVQGCTTATRPFSASRTFESDVTRTNNTESNDSRESGEVADRDKGILGVVEGEGPAFGSEADDIVRPIPRALAIPQQGLWALAHLDDLGNLAPGPEVQAKGHDDALVLDPTILVLRLRLSRRIPPSFLWPSTFQSHLEHTIPTLFTPTMTLPATTSTLSPRKSASPALTVRVGRERSGSMVKVKVEKVGDENQADVLDQSVYDNLNAEWVNRKGTSTATILRRTTFTKLTFSLLSP